MLRPEGSKPPRWIHFLKILTSPWSLPSKAIPWSRPSSNIEIRHSSTASSVLLQVCRNCCWMLTPDSTAHCGSGPRAMENQEIMWRQCRLELSTTYSDPTARQLIQIPAFVCTWDAGTHKYTSIKVYNHLRMYCVFGTHNVQPYDIFFAKEVCTYLIFVCTCLHYAYRYIQYIVVYILTAACFGSWANRGCTSIPRQLQPVAGQGMSEFRARCSKWLLWTRPCHQGRCIVAGQKGKHKSLVPARYKRM